MIGPHCVVQVIPASSSHLQHLFFFLKKIFRQAEALKVILNVGGGKKIRLLPFN